MSRYFTYKTALLIFFISLITYLVIVSGVFLKSDVLTNMSQGSRYIRYIYLELLLIFPLWLYIKVNKQSIKRVFRLRAVEKLHLPLILLISVGLFIFLLGIQYISYRYGWKAIPVHNDMILKQEWNILLLIPLSGIITPLVEEMIFRGFLFRIMLDRKYSPVSIIFLSSLLFSLVHLNSAELIPIFFAGLILGFIAYFFHSTIPSIIIHSIFNILALVEINLVQIRDWFIDHSPIYTFLLILPGTLMLITGMLGVKNKVHIQRKRKEKEE